ncbi:hypothetical protein H6CHR_05101 [Variovorax sp. PBL-H6]|uniref:hypothetical protein n=1 Tax=Variovorax sp. PBL-H6 TaxID=434009 RepID=UPI0013177455|nr:hypothetical protein [Variovorax sp. PBL-H6]VTU37954.1 hypothetical protein H6CHR_05101 [Variovorax sp. PBL-H6]
MKQLKSHLEKNHLARAVLCVAMACLAPASASAATADEPPRETLPSFGELIAKPQEVARSYDEALDALAVKIAQNIRHQLRPASARISAVP